MKGTAVNITLKNSRFSDLKILKDYFIKVVIKRKKQPGHLISVPHVSLIPCCALRGYICLNGCHWVSRSRRVSSPRDTGCTVIRKWNRTECAVLIWLKNTTRRGGVPIRALTHTQTHTETGTSAHAQQKMFHWTVLKGSSRGEFKKKTNRAEVYMLLFKTRSAWTRAGTRSH